ncbi:MAG: ATP-binding protein, partial [Nitrospirota bacterium]|nr:ATP-binding protein [Nitrospirota bacterium]
YALNQKYPEMNNNKVLKITARKTELDGSPHIQLSFYDSGTGITENTMDKIMNPFFTTKPSNVGTGLGLSISHGIIDNHKGAITVRSVEGEFTEVIITLPAYNGRTEQ